MINKKRIKTRIFAVVLSIAIIFSNSFQVKAMSIEDIGSKVEIITEAALNAYEASVIARMSGRAGASTVKGAHGIAFEVLYMDKQNLQNFLCIFKPKEIVKLSESSIDQVADLIVVNSKSEVIGFIQCKDSPKGISKILNQVMEGQYDNATLVGTKECAKLFNKAAKEAGIDATMVDSGISHKLTTNIAEKALGMSLKSVIKEISGSATAGGIFCGALAAIDSKINKCSDSETFANITTSATNGSVSFALEKGTSLALTAGFITESSGALAVAGVFVAGMTAGTIAYVGLEKLESTYHVKEKISSAYDSGMTVAADFIVDCQDVIEEKTDIVSKEAGKTYKVAKKHINGVADEAVALWAEKITGIQKQINNIR